MQWIAVVAILVVVGSSPLWFDIRDWKFWK